MKFIFKEKHASKGKWKYLVLIFASYGKKMNTSDPSKGLYFVHTINK